MAETATGDAAGGRGAAPAIATSGRCGPRRPQGILEDMEILSELTRISGTDQLTFTILALLDATSIGTLAIPAVLLLLTGQASGIGARATAVRVLVYLAVIGAFYWVLGMALLSGLQAVLQPIGSLLTRPVGAVLMLVAGAALTAASWWWDPKEIRKRGGDPQAGMGRWIDRADRAVSSWRGVGVLALAAGLVEAATMVPYLAAIAGMGRYDLSPVASGAVLGLYCLVMVLPAALLALGRLALGPRLAGPLGKVRDLAVRSAPGAVAWGLGIVGVLLILRGIGQIA